MYSPCQGSVSNARGVADQQRQHTQRSGAADRGRQGRKEGGRVGYIRTRGHLPHFLILAPLIRFPLRPVFVQFCRNINTTSRPNYTERKHPTRVTRSTKNHARPCHTETANRTNANRTLRNQLNRTTPNTEQLNPNPTWQRQSNLFWEKAIEFCLRLALETGLTEGPTGALKRNETAEPMQSNSIQFNPIQSKPT